MGQVEVVPAVHAAGHDDADRRRVRLHVSDLHRRGVGAQQRSNIIGAPGVALHRRRQVQRVLHVARRMIARHVQRVEAVPLVLEFRAFDKREAHAREDRLHPIAHDGQRMVVAERRDTARQRDVNSVGGAGPLVGAFGPRDPAGLDGLLQLVRVPADVPLVGGRGARDRLHPRGDDAVFPAEIPVAHRLDLAGGLRRGKLSLERGDLGLDRRGIGERIPTHYSRVTQPWRHGAQPWRSLGPASPGWRTRRGSRWRARTGSCDPASPRRSSAR